MPVFWFLVGFIVFSYFNEMTVSSCLVSSKGVKQPAGVIGGIDSWKFGECGLK